MITRRQGLKYPAQHLRSTVRNINSQCVHKYSIICVGIVVIRPRHNEPTERQQSKGGQQQDDNNAIYRRCQDIIAVILISAKTLTVDHLFCPAPHHHHQRWRLLERPTGHPLLSHGHLASTVPRHHSLGGNYRKRSATSR